VLRRFLEALAGVQQRLGGDAADVQTGAAEGAAGIDARGLEPQLAQPDRRVVAARPAANDDGIELIRHGNFSWVPSALVYALGSDPARAKIFAKIALVPGTTPGPSGSYVRADVL